MNSQYVSDLASIFREGVREEGGGQGVLRRVGWMSASALFRTLFFVQNHGFSPELASASKTNIFLIIHEEYTHFFQNT